MKGVILAGGLGTRLSPLTKVTNKHLLPVYREPMICHPVRSMVEAGVKDLLIVTGGEWPGDFLKLLGNGSELGVKSLYYAYQEGHGGIAAALKLAEGFTGIDRFVVILGDNIFEGGIKAEVEQFRNGHPTHSRIVLKRMKDCYRFGVAKFVANDGQTVIEKIVEKPKFPPSEFGVTGLYMYTKDVYRHLDQLKPSGRNELEITDLNNALLADFRMDFSVYGLGWSDAGTFESLYRASTLARDMHIDTIDKLL
jgi:glucose-1-phosphate thymidylyltransferase